MGPDDLDAQLPADIMVPLTEPTVNVARGYPHVHSYKPVVIAGELARQCSRCGKVRDEAMAKRGRGNRSRGADAERRAERRYGWEKIGERGSIVDLRGKHMKVQSKTSRTRAPSQWRSIFTALDTVADGRTPAILYSYTGGVPGTPADDYVVLRGADWLRIFGTDPPEDSE